MGRAADWVVRGRRRPGGGVGVGEVDPEGAVLCGHRDELVAVRVEHHGFDRGDLSRGPSSPGR